MWDEVKRSEQGQPRAGDCSFLLLAVAINKDQDIKKRKRKNELAYSPSSVREDSFKETKNNTENNKPGFLEIKAELKAA